MRRVVRRTGETIFLFGNELGKLRSNLEVLKAGRIAFLYRQLNDE